MRGPILLSALALVGAASAQGDVLVSGTVNAKADGTSTVNRIRFEVSGNARVDFDVLAWELDLDLNRAVDLNGDGEIAVIDPFIRIHRDDGHLDRGDYVGGNDNSSSTFGDGSLASRDSYLSLNLTSGRYILTIGGNLSLTGFPTAEAPFPGTLPLGTTLSNDHGDYLITVIGPVSIVPAPGAAALLGLGGLVVGRRRR